MPAEKRKRVRAIRRGVQRQFTIDEETDRLLTELAPGPHGRGRIIEQWAHEKLASRDALQGPGVAKVEILDK